MRTFLETLALTGVVLALISCSGERGPRGFSGADGAPGIDGTDGRDGIDGRDGVDGKDAVLEVIDPCGDNPGKFDEHLFLLATPDGECIAAYFRMSRYEFLTCIPPGNYVTTDQQRCRFQVTEDGDVVWEEREDD